MWLAQHAVISIAVATVSSATMNIPFKPLALGMLLANLVDLDHAFNVGSDNGHANSLTIHIFHIYSGMIASVFYLLALKFKTQRYLLLGVCYGVIFHMGADAIATFLNYKILYLLITSLILFAILWYILNKFRSKKDRNLIFISVLLYTAVDFTQMYVNYFVLSNSYLYSSWSWIIAVILLFVYCLLFHYLLMPRIEDR